MNGIVQQFLTFARPPKIELKEIPAEQFLSHISTLFGAQASAKSVRFNSHVNFEGVIRIDTDQMTQALLNLLQNALDATASDGTISLELTQKGAYTVFEIADDGTGIPADRMGRIFDLYFTTKPEGTGMGLAITQQIVAQHQGMIDVESGPKQGTTFSISIPI